MEERLEVGIDLLKLVLHRREHQASNIISGHAVLEGILPRRLSGEIDGPPQYIVVQRRQEGRIARMERLVLW